MAAEKDDKKKAKPAAAAKAEKPAAKAKADKPAKAAKAAAPYDGPPCRVEGCKQPVRAKGYCRKHFMAWRRARLGAHHHYKICSKEACRKKREFGGLCPEHAGKGQPALGGGHGGQGEQPIRDVGVVLQHAGTVPDPPVT